MLTDLIPVQESLIQLKLRDSLKPQAFFDRSEPVSAAESVNGIHPAKNETRKRAWLTSISRTSTA